MRDAAIRRWRRELEHHGLDRSTVDELVDHYQSLIDLRLATDEPLASAIEAARADLGDPAAIAREHARVRPAFGPRPSRVAATTAFIALVAAALIINESYYRGLSLGMFFTGPAVLRTTALLALLVFRSPQAAAYLFGATACELGMWLANGLHTAIPAGDVEATTELVLLIGACAMLATRRPTRWYVSTAALAWTITTVDFYDVHMAGGLATLAVSLLASAAVLAVGARARLAWPLCAVVCVVTLAATIQPLVAWLRAPWESVPGWWQFDAVSWHAMKVVARLHGVVTLAAPIVAVAALRGSRGRSTRELLGDLRRNRSTPSGA